MRDGRRLGAAGRGARAGGRAAPAPAAARGEPRRRAGATTAAPLDISKLLTDDEIRGVTGYVGKFEDGKLTDLPTTEFYDSRHFKALGKPESYDVGLRVWRLGHRRRRGPVPQADERRCPARKATDEVGDASFRAQSGDDRRPASSWCASAAWWCR